ASKVLGVLMPSPYSSQGSIDDAMALAKNLGIETMTLPIEPGMRALLGTRDYVRKCGFNSVVLGLSGGVDSALTAAIAADAIGPDKVLGVLMPSPFSSKGSIDDALELSRQLGIETMTLPIEAPMKAMDDTLSPAFRGLERDVTEENIQARIRGNLLMALSNKRGALLLTTGNKSELAVGYCTLYGDMSGGLGVLGDVGKLDVYRLARYINRKAGRDVIPRAVLRKKPSPELKRGQVDPFDFDVVGPLVDEIVENRRGAAELVAMGFPPEVVDDTLRRIRRAEYKRWQAAPCIKITRKAFGIGWKMPIVNKYPG
ncbi:MAG TPA: NAD(+) synthase, partial [Terriglobales bacterium]|nr:NAD(+) synthase [Terriglobales bacterium]